MKIKNKQLLAIALLLLSLGLTYRGARAANQPVLHGITVTPAYQQVILSGQAELPVNFTITNNEPVSQTLNFSTADFNTLGDTGGLLFVGANPTALQKKYGLAKWISLNQKSLTLAAKQTANIQAKILNLPDLSPGGHYGALMINIGNKSSGGTNNVSLNPVASSLIFLTKTGGDTHKLSLSHVGLSSHLLKLPSSVTLLFHNDGNTHLIPRGVVTLSNRSGQLVSKGIVNVDSDIILPETSRQYYVPLQTIDRSDLPGSYKLKVDFRFDGISQFRSYERSIFYIPLLYLIGLILLVIAAILIGRVALKKRKVKHPKSRKIKVHVD